MHLQSLSRIAAFAFCLGTVLSATESRAEIALLTCPVGTSATTYKPPLTNTAKDTQVHSDAVFGPCTGLTSTNIASALFTYDAFGKFACGPSTGTASFTIRWSDGTTSKSTGAVSISLRPAGEVVATIIGSITEGRFQGGTINYTVVLAQTDLLACATTGVPSVAGPATLTLLSLVP
ncbi:MULTISPECIES: hypothetical protein [unclassified Corallococcus]|uniref:hypothetical protein n=1 Tax=unclassified Corallococcus TaxID=2685029 RepID=UPI001A90175E|nr:MULTISPECIES: hypothetical protein [unclassified Corallococcus]MBN9682026.1 hypothetical protein [Corallococcus sp. NCSPR001]WAS86410.1 hypothetical protein O0N60_05410 [Corallococcus sp. NCRR]